MLNLFGQDFFLEKRVNFLAPTNQHFKSLDLSMYIFYHSTRYYQHNTLPYYYIRLSTLSTPLYRFIDQFANIAEATDKHITGCV
jgi:hypothetical protein